MSFVPLKAVFCSVSKLFALLSSVAEGHTFAVFYYYDYDIMITFIPDSEARMYPLDFLKMWSKSINFLFHKIIDAPEF